MPVPGPQEQRGLSIRTAGLYISILREMMLITSVLHPPSERSAGIRAKSRGHAPDLSRWA